MRRSAFFAFLAVAAVVASTFLGSPPASAKPRRKPKAAHAGADFDTKLPVLGTRLSEFPPGPARAVADQACLACHSADMVWQQHLTEAQWTAEVNKMAGWGSDLPEDKKQLLIGYLVSNFGPENDKFQPVVTRPVGK